MTHFRNWKTYVRAALGGAIVYVVGSYLVNPINQFLTFIPATDLLIKGLTPHVVIAYGTAVLLADWLGEKFLKM